MSSLTESDVKTAVGDEGAASPVTFAGDTGQLPTETRRVLVQLLLGPALDAERHTKLWPTLIRDESVIRSRLHELFLELVIDHDQRVAFTRQLLESEIDMPILLRKAPLTFLQSAVVLFLRQQLIQAEARGERAVVSREEIIERLHVFEQENNRDQAKFERQANGAVERAKELSLIRKLRNADERYEVSPTLKLLFPAEEIQALTRTYEQLRSAGIAPGTTQADGDEEQAPESEQQ